MQQEAYSNIILAKLVTSISLCFCILFSNQIFSQGIDFRDDYWLEKAIQIAKIEDKNIFIDTYTPWCGPCKLMDIQFQDPLLADYLNEKYVNVKINMDSSYGISVKKAYDVFFLPTLLILDKYGNVKYASEGTLTSDELLAIAAQHHNAIYRPALANNSNELIEPSSENTSTYNQANNADNQDVKSTPTKSNSVTKTKTQNVADSKEKGKEVETAELMQNESIGPNDVPPSLTKEEKILYTQNDASKDPEFLYSLTYLKMQLQDGTQWSAAEKYLATQKDWTTKKNMKFIYDFVRRPNTKLFDHLIKRRAEFEILFGQENVTRSIAIMVNMQMNQGIPRPDFNEALQLYKLIDADFAERNAYSFILERYEIEENQSKYVEYAIPYILEINPDDFAVINNIGMFYENVGQVDLSLNEMAKLQEHAIEVQGGTYYKLYDTLSGLYVKQGRKKKAMQAIEKALDLAINAGIPLKDIKEQQALIESL